MTSSKALSNAETVLVLLAAQVLLTVALDEVPEVLFGISQDAQGVEDLWSATKSFSERLGGGDFRSVFKGTLPDGSPVAVKKLKTRLALALSPESSGH